jgi:hypothetical protein
MAIKINEAYTCGVLKHSAHLIQYSLKLFHAYYMFINKCFNEENISKRT